MQYIATVVLIEEQVSISVEQADQTRRVACSRANHTLAVGTLEIRLDHFVILAITQSHGFDPWTF